MDQNQSKEQLYEKSKTGCCPRFNPKPWDEREVIWKDKLFLKDRVRSIFHIPLNFGQVIVKNIEKIKNAHALPSVPLMLSDENSLWGADIYIAVSTNVPNSQMAKISGTFLTKIFEGSFQNVGKWAKEMYFFYTTCPACANYYGKNYVVILAQI